MGKELGYIWLKDGFSVEGQEKILAEKIADYRKKKQKFDDKDFTIHSLLRPRPGHVTQTSKNMAKIMGAAFGSVAAGSIFGHLTRFDNIGYALGMIGFFYSILFYSQKVANVGHCDLCGVRIHTEQSLFLKDEKREGFAEYILCDDCYQEKESEHIPFEDMRWSWKNFGLVKSGDTDNKSGDDH